ncbi:hypothetical protein ACJJTC_013516 [Scirpophaga incertulas]
MDPERQPLLEYREIRCRRYRPLNREEILMISNHTSWRRARLCLVLMFWAIMAMFLSIITCILVTTPKCRPYDKDPALVPSVPPVHMSFTPIVSNGRVMYNDVGQYTS